MKKRLFQVLCLLSLCSLFLGNVPAPWYACDGKKAGDTCTYGYGCANNGVCTLQTECKDDPKTTVNECLTCKTN